jgi:polyisoprenoid-binding protein YceI
VNFSTRAFLAVFVFLIGGPASAAAVRFDIKDVGFRNSLHFVSDAPFETIVGVTNFISGWLELDPTNLKDGVRGYVEVDTRTFETGMPARNAKVRELFLGSAKQPVVTFTLNRLTQTSAPTLKAGSSITARAEGTVSAHGLEKSIVIPLRLTYWKEAANTKKRLAGNLLQVRADFPLRLNDFRVSIPAPFQGSVQPEVKFSAHLFGSDRIPTGTPP